MTFDGLDHYSVLLNESIDGLNIDPDGVYFDLTLGGGGHSEKILQRLDCGRLVCFDADADAIDKSKARLEKYKEKITFVHDNFRNVGNYFDSLGIVSVNGAIADLGVSSFQLDCAKRGFSYMMSAPLDMRMDKSSALTAYTVINTYSEQELKRIIYSYGEENFAPSIAKAVVKQREIAPIETTCELAELVKNAIPPKARAGGHHPAKKTFQAIRIEVNGELDSIEPALTALIERLAVGGRIAVISFHSLEDRIVKNVFASAASGCICPREFPVCVCGKTPKVKIITKKPILPSASELEENHRSRSAKLRIIERI